MNDLNKLLQQGSVKAARGLLGWQLFVREADGSLAGGIITETEAYHQDDAASHSYRGETPRTKIMFGPAGHIYVYFTYGMHWCMNIVTGKAGHGEAVLIRSLEPTRGIELMKQRRDDKPAHLLTNGPAKLCQALAVTGKDNGAKVNQSRFVMQAPMKQPSNIEATERVGITKDTHRLWRFVIPSKSNKHKHSAILIDK